ncbi:MAG: hypothetical protein NTV80_02135 [Verrucomicrobia bacterium]|nr:hypothetical protein [Verrucomicrobiota bacterium]
MAWQLIYTSAPRLLEAGRTGFGTVARHRAVVELVAGAVERLSQFARLPGLGARRIIRSHRIITAGASQVHVFSCIRDAGSDYTGRTNHLAHHLIAEAREVKLAAEEGITPADILMQMKWRTAWNEPPRFLEPLEEVSLLSLRARTLGSAWEQLMGQADFSVLPTQSPRCFIILPGESDALPLIQESLRGLGAESMHVTFTTHLEPTDDVAGFRWAAMNAGSPLRRQADGIARNVLDLTAPQTLPQLGSVAKQPTARHSRESLTEVQATTNKSAEMDPSFMSPPSSFMEALPPLPKARSGSFSVTMIAALLVVGAGLGTYFWLAQQPRQQQPSTTTDLAKRVDELWQKHHLALPTTSTWLKGQADAGLIESHQKSLQMLKQSLKEPLQSIDIPRPESTQDEFMEMLQSFTQWQRNISESVRDEVWSSDSAPEMKLQARLRLDQEERLWKTFSKNFRRPPIHPDLLRTAIAVQVLKQCNKSTPPPGAAEDWRDIIEITLTPSPRWPELWVRLSRLPAFPASLPPSDKGIFKEAASDNKAPAWLQQLAQRRLNQITEMNQADAAALQAKQKAEKPMPSGLQVTSADGPLSTHPRYVILETAEIDLTESLESLPDLPVEEDMQIIAGSAGFNESNLVRWRALGGPGVYRKSFTDSAILELLNKRLTKVPSTQDSMRILGRSSTGSTVLFEVILLARKAMPIEVWHTHPAFQFENRYENQRTTLEPAAARWLAQISFIGVKPQLRLQSMEDPARRFRIIQESGEAVIEIETRQQKSVATAARVTTITAGIESLKQGIRIDQERQAKVAEGNLAKREKEDSQFRSQQAISNKEIRIMQMEEEMRGLTALTAAPPPLLGIPAGRYALVAVVFDPDGSENATRLCELTITSQQAKKEL